MVANIRVHLFVVFVLVVSLWLLVPTKYPIEELYSKDEYFEDMSIVYYDLGTLCMKRKDYKKAVKNFKTSINYFSQNIKAYRQLLACYRVLGKTKKADAVKTKIKDLEDALKTEQITQKLGVSR
ncbi:MAG: hypothetical protein H6679_05690 [Epsilonproteobacteria bacterium]|nr:hypothetical protein [Campylobacterota bacterium]